jgi:signal transduction histidine kinase
MKSVGPTLGTGRKTLLAGLAFIIAGFGAANMTVLWKERALQSQNRTAAREAFARSEQLTRLVHNLDRKRLLIDNHIVERTTQGMTRLELQLANVDLDLARVADSYESLAIGAAERGTWRLIEAELAEVEQPLQRVLALSRNNDDDPARAGMRAVDERYDDINHHAEQLMAINRDSMERTAKTIESLQHRSLLYLEGLTLAGVAFWLLIAGWMIRAMAQRDDLVRGEVTSLESRNQELDAFAGRVAHDLRGPLTTITLSADRLAQRLPREDGTSSILSRGIARMETLIRDLLALSRVDAQAAGAASHVEAVVETVAEELSPKVKEVDGALRIEVEPASVRCSEGLLREALVNIGENAVKYRRPDSPLVLEIHGHDVGRRYELRLSDNGAGMSPAVVRRAFEPLFRGDVSQSTPGTGLGLSIVKRIVENSGGTISIESEVGRGTTFVVNLPLQDGGKGTTERRAHG